jgi:hypothetical protein
MIEADRVLSTPPLNSSSIQATNPPQEARADVDSFSHQPGIGQPKTENLTSDSAKPIEEVDLAQLRFVRCLVRYGATLDEAAIVVARELDRLRIGAAKHHRRMTLVGMRLVPVGRTDRMSKAKKAPTKLALTRKRNAARRRTLQRKTACVG